MIKIPHHNIPCWVLIVVGIILQPALGDENANILINSSGDSTASTQIRDEIYRLGEKNYIYHRPAPFDFIKHFPGNLIKYTRDSFQRENWLNWGAMITATALLVAVDQPLLDETQRFGRKLGLKGTNRMKPVFHVAGFPIEMPHDIDTALYFIGDGWTHTSIAALFLGYGLIAGNNRALQTASQIAEGMITTGLSTQILKHITGRESPFVATVPGGKWRPFPNQVEYHKHVPNYDAFPSGHLATAMMTLTVIAENYPENKFIKPIGYSLLTILSFEMVNNGVHWVSDYPLALAMGYSLGKIAVSRGRKSLDPRKNRPAKQTRNWSLLPTFHSRGMALMITL